jgi:hypothetical protein
MFPDFKVTASGSEGVAGLRQSQPTAGSSQRPVLQRGDRLSFGSSADSDSSREDVTSRPLTQLYATLPHLTRVHARNDASRPLADVPVSPSISDVSSSVGSDRSQTSEPSRSISGAWLPVDIHFLPRISEASTRAGTPSLTSRPISQSGLSDSHSEAESDRTNTSESSESSFGNPPQHARLSDRSSSSGSLPTLYQRGLASQESSVMSLPSLYSQASEVQVPLHNDGRNTPRSSISSVASWGNSQPSVYEEDFVMPAPNTRVSTPQISTTADRSQQRNSDAEPGSDAVRDAHRAATYTQLTRLEQQSRPGTN